MADSQNNIGGVDDLPASSVPVEAAGGIDPAIAAQLDSKLSEFAGHLAKLDDKIADADAAKAALESGAATIAAIVGVMGSVVSKFHAAIPGVQAVRDGAARVGALLGVARAATNGNPLGVLDGIAGLLEHRPK